MAMIGWLVVFVALVGIEAGTMALTTIWFAAAPCGVLYGIGRTFLPGADDGISGGLLCPSDLYKALCR